MALTCTPKQRLTTLSCLSCLSEKELLAAFIVALAIDGGYTLPTDTNTLLSDSKCFECLSDKQLGQAIISAYLEKKAAGISINTVKTRIKCLSCATPKQLKAAIAYLTCKNLG